MPGEFMDDYEKELYSPTDNALERLRQQLAPLWDHAIQQIEEALRDVDTEVCWVAITKSIGLGWSYRPEAGAGRSLCPMHDEKTPSFWMYPSGVGYCYGCGYHTTPAQLMMDQTLQPLDECLVAVGVSIDEDIVQKIMALREQEYALLHPLGAHSEPFW